MIGDISPTCSLRIILGLMNVSQLECVSLCTQSLANEMFNAVFVMEFAYCSYGFKTITTIKSWTATASPLKKYTRL